MGMAHCLHQFNRLPNKTQMMRQLNERTTVHNKAYRKAQFQL